MNSLVVPPSPNWYNVQILASASDNTLIYGSKNDLVLICPTPEGNPLKVKFVDQAHSQRVVSVDINIQWGSPNKWVLSSGDDNYVKLWNIEKLENISSHDLHKEYKDKLVGARFLTENRVLSVSESGIMYIWQPSTKECTKLCNFFSMKVTISCFSPCPHATFITAFGLKNGLIIVANLKKNGSLMYKLRGHNNDVVSLSWCPAPVNIFPSKPNNFIKGIIQPEKESHLVTGAGEKDIEENENQEGKENKRTEEQEDSCEIVKNYDDSLENLKTTGCIEITEEKIKVDELLVKSIQQKDSSEDEEIQDDFLDNSKLTGNIERTEEKVIVDQYSVDCELSHAKINIVTSETAAEIAQTTTENKEPTENNDQKLRKIPTILITEEEIQNDGEFNGDEDKNSEISKEHVNEESPINNSDETNTTIPSMCLEEDPRKEYLLASSGKDNAIYIWRAGTDGRMQSFFRIPEKKVFQRKNKKVKDLAWTVLKWITPFTLLTATRKGEILKYTLPRPISGQKQCTIVHNEHKTLIFSIVAHAPTLTTDNWLSKLDISFWTFGHDMYLLNTALDSKITHLATIETFCALVNCLAQSPLDPSRVALGLSNGTIKIWNVYDPHIKNFSTVNYSPKIHSKITYLAWHPTNELLLAFCTEEGTVGFLNTNNLQKATWFKQTFANTVHKVQWGPRDSKIGLFAAGEGDLICFNPEEPKEEPLKIKLPEDTYAYTFAWKLDKSLLLVVHNGGKMMVFSPNFSVKAIYYQKKKLLSVVWHPESECNSEEATPKSYWVAAALDNAVYIFDFAEVSHKDGTLDIQDITITVLEGHESNVRCLAWCPFNGDKLVSAGEDGLAHVWNVSTKQILASYYGQNFQPLKSIIWSPLQEETLICSATNASLVVWKMSDYPAPLDKDILAKCKLRIKNEKKCIIAKVEVSADKIPKKIKKSIKNAILPVMNTGNNDNVSEKVKLLRDLLEWKENGGDLETNGMPSLKQLFGNKQDVLKLLNVSETSHMEKDKHEAASMVSFWKGDLQTSIKDAIDHHKVSPLLISLAPTISLSLWQKACETYALQSEEKSDSDPLEIATYYMACQNIEKAIECLCEREMFKEALILAKCRLPEDNVFVEDILHKWASFSSYCGSLETAAQCYIVLGKFEDAVKVLFRRSEIDILNFALELAIKSNNTELIKAVEFRCKAFAAGDNIGKDTESLPDRKDLLLENSNKSGNSELICEKEDEKFVQYTEQIIENSDANEVIQEIEYNSQFQEQGVTEMEV